MKIAGIKSYAPCNSYGAQKTNNAQKNNSLNFLGTKPLKNLSHDTVSFGMKGSGKVNDLKALIDYVDRNNAAKILKTLLKCKYSKADILTSGETKLKEENGKVFLTNFNSIDHDNKFYGSCRELMIKAGKEIKENCSDLNVYGATIYNEEYGMSHCVLLAAKKDSDEDTILKNNLIAQYQSKDILFIDPSFRSYEFKPFLPFYIKSPFVYSQSLIDLNNVKLGDENEKELVPNEHIIIGSYDDIASDLKLQQVRKQFGSTAKNPLCAIYNDGSKAKFTIVNIEQDHGNEISQFVIKNLEPYTNGFIQSI